MQEGINGTRCLPAPDGTIANPFGSSTYEIAKGWHATQCDPVSFICQNSEPCERGTIGTWPATSKCLFCPSGWTSYRGSLDCSACESGKFAPFKGATSCESCSEFMYQPIPAQKECLQCGTFERGDSARIKCVEARTATAEMLPPSRPVAISVTGSTVTFRWETLFNSDANSNGVYTPTEIVVEWCSNDLFLQEETNITVVSSSTSVVVVPTKISPTNGGTLVRLTSRNQNYRSKLYSPISALWEISPNCRGSYLDTSGDRPFLWNCTQCPVGASCTGVHVTNDGITAQAGHWRLSNQKYKDASGASGASRRPLPNADYVRFAPCLLPAACVGAGLREEATGIRGERCNTELGFRSWCNESYLPGTGGGNIGGQRCRLCAACLPHYQHVFGREECQPCPAEGDTTTQVIFLFCTLCVFFTLFALLVYCRAKGRGRKSVSSGVRKIIINFLQVSSLSLAWSVPWPDSITWMLVAESFSSSISEATISLTCSMPRATAFQVMQAGQIMWTLSPLVIILAMTTVYASAVCYLCPKKCGNGTMPSATRSNCELWRKRHKKTYQSPKDNWVMASLYTLYLMYPALTASSFSLLRCVEIDNTYYLRGDLQVECYSWTGHGHMWWVAGLSIPCVIVFVVGLPLAGIATLWTRRSRLFNRSHPKHRWAMVRYGLLYDGYREEAWWFEVIVAMRKAGFVAMSMLTEGRLQVQIAVGFLALMVALNICIQPYGLGTGAFGGAGGGGSGGGAANAAGAARGPSLAGGSKVNSTHNDGVEGESSTYSTDQIVGTGSSMVGHQNSRLGLLGSSPDRLSVLRGKTTRSDAIGRSDSWSSSISRMTSVEMETPEEREHRMKRDKYNHAILHRMDLVRYTHNMYTTGVEARRRRHHH